MKKKEAIINRMLDILTEINEYDDEIIDHFTFKERYMYAIKVLSYPEGEPGENDLFKFIYNFGKRYFYFYNKLKQILINEGLTDIEQRKDFIKKTFVLEELK